MKCPHLLRGDILVCKSEERPYTPSRFELKEYCKAASHRKCPLYLRSIIGKIEIDAFKQYNRKDQQSY